MTKAEVMKRLRGLGSAQTVKTYARHGITGKVFGVSYSNLRKLQRELKGEHGLAEGLWDTENHDARILATLVADPGLIEVSTLNRWARGLRSSGEATALADLAARTPASKTRLAKWTSSRKEWIATAGYYVMARLAQGDADVLSDDEFLQHLVDIEGTIHDRESGVRYAMNKALIAIGIRNSRLEKAALAAAKRIGQIEVDHGDTSCKTPDAASYIRKGVAQRKKKKKRGGRK